MGLLPRPVSILYIEKDQYQYLVLGHYASRVPPCIVNVIFIVDVDFRQKMEENVNTDTILDTYSLCVLCTVYSSLVGSPEVGYMVELSEDH